MAIVNMKKITLAAPKNEKEEILNFLQSEGCVEVIHFKDAVDDIGEIDTSAGKSVSETEIKYNHIKFTYDFLIHYYNKKEGIFKSRQIVTKDEFESLESRVNWYDVYEESKKIEELINQNKNQRAKISAMIEQYSLWSELDVNNDELNSMKRVSYFIGTISKKHEAQIIDDLKTSFDDVYIEILSEKQQDLNIFILCHKKDYEGISDILKNYSFSKLNLDLAQKPKEQVEILNGELERLNSETSSLTKRAEKMAENLKDIEKIYDFLSSRLEKEKTALKLMKTDKTFILFGWIPESSIDEFLKRLNKRFNDIYITLTEPDEEDDPPIVLKNNKIAEPFEAITSMYALPKWGEVDPTPVLTPFYLLFFGMMMADVGYGLLMLFGSLFLIKKMDAEEGTKKILKLLLYCSIPTIIFGFLYGGFFGGIIKLKPLWLDPVNEPMEVLKVSIVLGVIHLFVGLGVKAYSLIKSGNILDAVYDVLLWYVLLIGLIWMLLGGGAPAKWMSIAGAAGLIATQGRANESIVGKIFGGLYGLYGVTGYLGDALSYSRLLALGLASGLIGWSFNLLIQLLGKGPAAFIFGPLIFVAGHTFNFLIGALGTFVHTCRLQYLEFFGKFYEGGGKAFEPLKINTKFIKINSER